MIARALLTSALVATLALVVAAPAPAASKPCGKVSLGFTDARVRGEGMPCKAARELFQAWRRVAREEAPTNGPAPARLEVGSFRCVFGGSDLLIKLRCRDGGQVMRARWGG